MFDPERLLGQLVSGALGGALGGRVDRRRGSVLGGVGLNKASVGLGLLGVAMAAWEHYGKASAAAAPASAATATAAAMPPAPPMPPPPPMDMATRAVPMLDLRRQEAMLLVRAVIAACAADGVIDEDERAGILQKAGDLGDDAESLQFLQGELAHPVTVAELVAQTPRSLADEVYSAALLAIEVDNPRETEWLDALAHGLGIAPQARSALHAQLGLG